MQKGRRDNERLPKKMHQFTLEDLQKALDFAKQSQQSSENAVVHGKVGSSLQSMGNPAKSFKWQQHMEGNASEMLKKQMMMEALVEGEAYYKKRHFQKTIECFKEVFAIAEDIGDGDVMAIAFNCMGLAYRNLGRCQLAIDCYRKCLEISEKIGDRLQAAAAFGNMGVAYKSIGEFQNAIDCHRKQLDIAEKLGEKREIGNAYGNMGFVYNSIGQHQKAIDCHRRHLSIAEEIGERAKVGSSLGGMGGAYRSMGQYQKAMNCHRKYLAIASETGDKVGAGIAFGNMGNVYGCIGQYQTAIEYHRKELKHAEEIGDRARVGKAYGHIGNMYLYMGQSQKAIDYHHKRLEIAKEMEDREHVGEAYGDMGCAYDAMGQFQKAIDYYSMHLEIAKKQGNRKGVGYASGNMGIAYSAMHQYNKAIDCFDKHLEIAKEAGDKRGEILAFGNIANTYCEIGQYQKAIDCISKSLKLAKDIGDKRGVGLAFGMLSAVYMRIGSYQKALDCSEKYLAIVRKIGDKREVGNAHGHMGNAYTAIGQYQKALTCFRKHLEFAQEVSDRHGEGVAFGNMAFAYQIIGQCQKAIDCDREALKIAEEVGNILGVAKAQFGIALCCRKNDAASACSLFAKSILNFQRTRRSVTGNDDYNTSTANIYAHAHKALVESLLDLTQVKAALLVSDSGKAQALNDLTRRAVDVITVATSDDTFQAISEDPCSKNTESLFHDALANVIRVMKNDSIISYTFDVYGDLHAWVVSKKGVFHKEWQIANGMSAETYLSAIVLTVREGMFRDVPGFLEINSDNDGNDYEIRRKVFKFPDAADKRRNKNTYVCDLERRIQNLMTGEQRETSKPNDDFLAGKCVRGRYNLDTPLPEKKDLFCSTDQDNEGTKRAIQKISGCYSLDILDKSHVYISRSSQPSPKPPKEYNDIDCHLEKLYSILIAPIEEHLSGSKALIVAEGSLFTLPFAALLSLNKDRLCAKYSLHFAPALHVLNVSLTKPFPRLGPALFVGNPTVGSVNFHNRLINVPPLPGAVVEAKQCSKYFNAEPLLEKNATKENVLKNMKHAGIVHVSAHGHMDNADIFLAPNEGAPNPPAEEHYLLTAKDVLDCTLKARLVVLSCCHSGRGQISAEGVVGIARSFLGAGARSVLVTLWKIPDEPTMEFMKLFYEIVCQGLSVCVALQQAMIELKKKYPIQAWAPFQIVGEDIVLTEEDIEEIRRQSSEK